LNDADNLRYLAFSLHGVGDNARAIEMCNAWLALAPSTYAAGYRSLLQFESGDMPSAVDSAREVISGDPDNSDANLVLGLWATEQQDMDEAAGRFERLLSVEPDNARAWVGLALVQLYRQEHDTSIASFKRALDLQPNDVGVVVALGWAQFTNKQIPAAEATFRRAVQLDHNFGEAHGGLATMLVWQNKQDEARREIALARRLDPKGFGMIYARGILMALEGRREQGEHLVAQNLQRTLRPEGRTIMDSVRIFLRSKSGRPPRTPVKRLPVRR
jgi:Flp pilus assembly protein TadD